MAQGPDLRGDIHRAIATLAGTGDARILRIAEALKLWSESSAMLEECLGVARTWRVADRRRRRDEIYINIAQEYFPDLAGKRLARAVMTLISRYESASWRHDRANGRRPEGMHGLAFDLLSLGVHRLDIEALKKLLAGKNTPCEYPFKLLGIGGSEDKEHGD